MLVLLGAGVIVAALAAAQFRTPYVMAARPGMYAIGAILVAGGAVTTSMFVMRRNPAVSERSSSRSRWR